MSAPTVAAVPAQCRPRLQAVLIDLDGTMVDTLGDFVQVLGATLEDLHLPAVPPEQVARMVGKGTEHLLRSVLHYALSAAPASAPASDRVEALFARAWPRYHEHYAQMNGRYASVYPGVQQGLMALQATALPLVCLTNKPTALAVQLLRVKGLEGFFTHVFGGDAFERKKPDPLPLLKACQALGTQPQHTLMVGDSSNDAQAARAAGCPVTLVTYGYNHGQPVRSVHADSYVDALHEVVPQWVCS